MEIDINIKTKEITGIITDDLEIIDDIKRKSILKVGIVREDYLSANFLNKVYEWMYYEIRRKRLILKNPKKKINDSLKRVIKRVLPLLRPSLLPLYLLLSLQC